MKVCDAQTTPKLVTKRVVLRGDNNQDLFFFPNERIFDLSCRVISAGEVSVADAEAIRDGTIKISDGTQAVEISRINQFKKIENEWVGKVRIRLVGGIQNGKQGYVFAKWVFPVKGKAATKTAKNYPIVSIYDTNLDFTFVFKSRKAFDLIVRGTAGEELTHEEQGVIFHGNYKLTRRTRARLISSKDNIPTSDGRYVGYSYIELIDGPHKGKRGFVVIDHVHK